MKIIKKENYKVPVFSWCPKIEDSAMEQIDHLAQLPFVYKRIVILPDCHMGYGMPIGAVIATKNIVIPNAVGVDIACGVCAVKTSLTEIDTSTIKKIMGEIRRAVPVGFKKHKKTQDEKLMPKLLDVKTFDPKSSNIRKDIVYDNWDNALISLGTLGGGNHFIEIQKGSDGHIWIMIHSGSRNLGLKIAEHYNKLAIQLNDKWRSSVPKSWELAFLPLDSEEGKAYLREMQYAVDYALANRKLIMDRILDIFSNIEGLHFTDYPYSKMINIAHNYCSQENHFGENVLVHRKGATQAKKGQMGIIPGSQGTKSYIVEGLGNPETFESCAHGAGRKMGRKQAQRTLNLKEEIKKLEDKGVIHAIRGVKDLDEAPGSYKSIEEVMKNQEDLVKVKVELSPLAVIKG